LPVSTPFICAVHLRRSSASAPFVSVCIVSGELRLRRLRLRRSSSLLRLRRPSLLFAFVSGHLRSSPAAVHKAAVRVYFQLLDLRPRPLLQLHLRLLLIDPPLLRQNDVREALACSVSRPTLPQTHDII
ncbi:hypothetical protein SESBI_46400, partial [Sesbania bispinosa]